MGSHRLPPFAQIEDGQKARTAVCTDDYAEGSDRDLAHLRVCFLHLVPDIFRILSAVGVQNVHVFAGAVRLGEIAEDALLNSM